MIIIKEIEQRSDIKMSYSIEGDSITVNINDVYETFDFSNVEDGVLESIDVEALEINPIISAKKTGDIISIDIIKFYGVEEKSLYERQEV